MDDPRDKPQLAGAFTVIFPGDIRKFAENPFDAKTVFGKPQSIGMGDALAALDDAKRLLKRFIADREFPGRDPITVKDMMEAAELAG